MSDGVPGDDMETEIVAKAAENSWVWDFIKTVGGLFGTVCSALLAVIWRQHKEQRQAIKDDIKLVMKDLEEVEEMASKCVGREEFERRHSESRNGIIDLREKIDNTAAAIHEKIDQSNRDGQARHNELMAILLQKSV